MLQSPTQMMKTSAAAMKKIASWDRHEECWEIHIPLPSKVEVKVEDGENWMNVMEEIHTALQENGISYATMGRNDGVGIIEGISLADDTF